MTYEEEKLTPVEKILLKIMQELFIKKQLTAAGEKTLAENDMFINYPSYFSLSTKAAGKYLTKDILEKKKLKN